jgi:hypothetical protein
MGPRSGSSVSRRSRIALVAAGSPRPSAAYATKRWCALASSRALGSVPELPSVYASATRRRQNDRVSVVKAQYGPTLPQILGRRSRGLQVAVAVLLALAIVGGAALALRARAGETALIVRGPATFNLVYPSQLKRVSEPNTLLALRRERGGLFLDSYLVRALNLPPYRGAVGGTLPVYATAYMDRLRKRYGPYELAGEGRTRINNAIGYQVFLRARRGGRTLYIRHLLLVPDDPEGARRGVVLELESTPAAGTPNALGVGNAGPLKQALRSFRFGTSREGGTQ